MSAKSIFKIIHLGVYILRIDFFRLSKTVWRSLHKTYVRPHVEYCIQAWNPWLTKDKEILEKYRKELFSWLLDSQELHMKINWERKRKDMIQVWKILHGQLCSAYLLGVGENERQPRMSSWSFKSEDSCWAHGNTEKRFYCKSYNIWMIFHIKSEVMNIRTFSKTSSITGRTTERPIKLEKRCFKLSHLWYININKPIKPIMEKTTFEEFIEICE